MGKKGPLGQGGAVHQFQHFHEQNLNIFTEKDIFYLKATALKITCEQPLLLVHNFPLIHHQMVALKVSAEHFSMPVSRHFHVCLLFYHCGSPGCTTFHALLMGWYSDVQHTSVHKYTLHSWDGIQYVYKILRKKEKENTGDSISQNEGGSTSVTASLPAHIRRIKDWAVLHINQLTGWQSTLLSAPYIHACPRLSEPQVIFLFHR